MIDYAASEKKMRDHARQWLQNNEVKYIIGYEQGKNSLVARPVFIYNTNEVEKLVWNPTCVDNLTRYLIQEMKIKPKKGETPDPRPIGIVVKPCDSKTIIELMKENIVPREKVKIIGMVSTGSINPKKLDTIVHEFSPEKRKNVSLHEKEKTFVVESDGKKIEVEKEKLLADKCKVCVLHNPVIADVVVGNKIEGVKQDTFEDTKEIEDMTAEERWAFWKKHLSRCVRCYACRDSCPLCYCEECIFDRTKPYCWNEKSVKLSENAYYHLVRAMHLAGRCVDCGECERTCPMDIPIRKINRYLLKRAKDRFKIHPGINTEDKRMFGSYDTEDPQEEIW